MNIDKIKEILKEEKQFSGVIQISQKDDVTLNIAKGYANRPDKLPNKVDTSFGIASGTKGFTALAVLKLIDDGKLSLCDNVFDILPYDFKNIKTPITVKQLLSHTSGIYDYYDEEVVEDFGQLFDVVPINKILGPSDMLPLLNTGDSYFSPGEKFKYCNSGFVILGILIEVVSGIKYADYLEENIIRPLGLKGTGCYKTNQLPANTAVGYLKNKNDEWISNIFEIPMVCTADGGLFTTLGDVNKVWDSFVNGSLISDKLKAKALQKRTHIEDNNYYGLGFYIACHEDGSVKNYALVGGDPGVSFLSRYYVHEDRIITLISNTDFGVWDLLKKLNPYL